MTDRFPLIVNSDTSQIEELSSGDNLDLTGNSIKNASSIYSKEFYGNLVGIATTAFYLSDAANILSGTISSSRLSGNYNINIDGTSYRSLYLADAANIQSGTINPSRLNGTYNINISGISSVATSLSNAANILDGTISASRLSGSYNINITGVSANSTNSVNVIGGIASVSQLKVSGISTLSSTNITNLQVNGDATVGLITATEYYGNGINIVGIVTQITIGTGLTLTSSQAAGKGVVNVGIRTSIGKTIFVSIKGDDNNSGLVETDAKRSIKAAVALLVPGDTVRVFPGTYVENNPIILPESTAINGTELRNCLVSPQNPDKDLFQVRNGCHITNLSFVGQPATNGASVVTFVPLLGVSTDRYFDAARLIRNNLDFIANESYGYITSTDYNNPAISISGISSFKNDIKKVWLSVAHDITRGGNSKCVGVGLSQYNNVGLKTETIAALQYSAGIAKSCINNLKFEKVGGGTYQQIVTQIRDLSIQADPATGSNQNINSCSNVISAVYSCVGVVTTIINNGPSAFGPSGITTMYPGNAGIGTTNPNHVPLQGVGLVNKGPYIRNCTNFIENSIGLKANGFDAEPGDQIDIGVQGAMSVDSYTQYNQNGIGVSITNGSYAQLVSIFTICDDIAIFTGSGGQCDLTNSNSSFGTYGLYSSGVGNNNTKSIFRYTGEVVSTSSVDQDKIIISGIGSQRPYDGQAIYFGELYYYLDTVQVTDGGSGYTSPPTVIIDQPTGPNGIKAEAIARVDNGKVIAVDIVSTGNQYLVNPGIAFTGGGGVGAAATTTIYPIYYNIESATLPQAGISTIVLTKNLNNTVSAGTTAYFARQSLQVATTISFEWVGSGNYIEKAKPSLGGVTIQENEVVMEDGGKVIYTSTNQAGNFKIGNDVTINQLTGAISGRAFSQSLLNTVTPLIIALGK